MTSVVTYADLNFNNIPMTENIYTGDSGSDHGDIMYENVENLAPPRFRDLPDPSDDPSNERKDPPSSNRSNVRLSLPAGCRLSLLYFLLFALLLSATIIGLSVKYVSKCQEMQRLSERLLEMNDSYSQRLRSAEDLLNSTKTELERTKKILEQLAEDLCPENWIMIGKKCLFFGEGVRSWSESESQCLRMSANLLTVRGDDEALKSYLSNKGDYWLGKEVRWKKMSWGHWRPEWSWPDEYSKYGGGHTWWKIQNGNITATAKWEQNAWICERDILLGKYFSVVSDKIPGFALHNIEYSCKRRE